MKAMKIGLVHGPLALKSVPYVYCEEHEICEITFLSFERFYQ